MLSVLDSCSKRKRALILCNGDPPGDELLRNCALNCDEIFCCDGAALYAIRAGIKCDVLVGDFDSLGGKEKSQSAADELGAFLVDLPEKKNMTDSQFAVEMAIESGAKEIYILGALGGRFDMALANAQLLCLARVRGAEAVLLDDYNQISATCTHMFIKGEAGDTVSLLPFGVSCVVRCTKGLEYPLYDYEMTLGDSRCISNVLTESRGYVEIAHGWVLVVKSRDKNKGKFGFEFFNAD